MTQSSKKRPKIVLDILCQPKAPKKGTNNKKVKSSRVRRQASKASAKGQSLHNTVHFSPIAFSPEALCQLQEQTKTTKEANRNADCTREKEHSVTIPELMTKAPRKAPPRANVTICPIDNIPGFVSIGEILDKPEQLEIWRLQRRTEELEQLVKIKDRKIEQALVMIAAEIHYYRSGLKTNVWETYDELQRRLHKLEAQLANLLDSTTGTVEHYVPFKAHKEER